MKRKKFGVDWSDRSYPEIKPWDPDEIMEGPFTLTAAKKNIDIHADDIIEHWRIIRRQTKALSLKDFK